MPFDASSPTAAAPTLRGAQNASPAARITTSARSVPPAERKRVTLKELLRWTYGHQLADVAVGVTLDEAGGGSLKRAPAALTSLPSCLARISELGVRVDGGAGPVIWADRYSVHPDALAVHRAVIELTPMEAQMAIQFGREGFFPEPYDALPRPQPREPSRAIGDRVGQAKIDGVERLYRIECLGEETIAVRRGKRQTLVGYKKWEILWCPLEYWPSKAWYEMVCDIDRRWREIAAKLEEKLRSAKLVLHEIIDGGMQP